MIISKQWSVMAGLALGALIAGCGASAPSVVARTASSNNTPAHIGDLPTMAHAMKTPLGGAGDPSYADLLYVVPFATAESFAGFKLLHFPDGQGPTPNIVVSVQTPNPGQGPLPATFSSESGIHVTYVPAGMSIHTSSWGQIIAAGGVDIVSGPQSGVPLPAGVTQQISDGSIARADVNGHAATIQRGNENDVTIGWDYTDSSGHTASLALHSNRSPDEMLQLARTVVEGTLTSNIAPA
jgi:hypothetical protein